MSVARPVASRLIFGRLAPAPASSLCTAATVAGPSTTTASVTATTPAPCHHQRIFAHHFHSSPQLAARRKPRFSSIRAAEMGLVDDKKIDEFAKEHFPKYTDKDFEELSHQYSAKHLEAIKAAEEAIDPRDLTIQGRLRVDPYTMQYIDDFAEYQPMIDKRPQNKMPPDPHARFMNLDEFTRDLVDWAEQFQQGDVTGKLKTLYDFVPEEWKTKHEAQWPNEVKQKAHREFQKYLQAEVERQMKNPDDNDGPTDADILQYIFERSAMTDNNLQSNSSVAYGLPKPLPGVAGMYKKPIDPADEGLDDSGVYQDLKRRTGMSVREILNIQTRCIVSRWVANQTRLGKIRKSSVVWIAGNGNGWLGIGEAKSTEASVANLKARLNAIANMRPIRRYEDRTIYGEVQAKVSGTIVKMAARPPGFGLRVSHRIFEMCRFAGIKDLAATMPRSRNPFNSVRAAYQCLLKQRDPEEIAMGRGRKLVDARKVYYGGAVY